MPSRTIHFLSYACLALVGAYLVLITATLFFASVKSSLTGELRERETAVASLETEYYDAIAALSTENYVSAGFVSPSAVRYVSAGGDAVVTRADR